MIQPIMGFVSLITAILAFVIMISWWHDTQGEWKKHSAGRSLMFLIFSTGIIAFTSAVASLTGDQRIFVIFQLLANVLFLLAVASFGYSRFKVQRYFEKKEREPK